jgi:FkbM family methyltransferase
MRVGFLLKRVLRIYRTAGLVVLLNTLLIYLWNLGHIYYQNIWWFILLQQKKGELIITTSHGQRMRLNRSDKGISRQLAKYHDHEPISTEIISTIIKEGMTIIDIGSNIGHYALIESGLVGSRGRIIAIEPMSENIELLNFNLKLNAINNVTVMQGAVSDYDGIGILYVSPLSNWNSLQKTPSWHPAQGTREINTMKLDTLINNMNIPVDLIRMDIEGGELRAFKGMAETLKKYKPRIAVEMHTFIIGKDSSIEIIEVLKSLGYHTLSVVDRIWDYPWNKFNNGIRHIDIDSLIVDKEMMEAEKIITIFFE